LFAIILSIHSMWIILSGISPSSDIGAARFSPTQACHKGHFALYNCLVLGHTEFPGVQRIYCNLFPAKTFYGSHRLDPVMIRPPGINHGAFVVSQETVWYSRLLPLFSASAQTDTGSKSFDCALVSTMETYNDPDNGCNMIYMYYMYYTCYMH
jgi:hypothetical protein